MVLSYGHNISYSTADVNLQNMKQKLKSTEHHTRQCLVQPINNLQGKLHQIAYWTHPLRQLMYQKLVLQQFPQSMKTYDDLHNFFDFLQKYVLIIPLNCLVVCSPSQMIRFQMQSSTHPEIAPGNYLSQKHPLSCPIKDRRKKQNITLKVTWINYSKQFNFVNTH